MPASVLAGALALVALLPTAVAQGGDGGQWRPAGGPLGGYARVAGGVHDGGDIYIVAQNSHLYRTTRLGTGWAPLPAPFGGDFFVHVGPGGELLAHKEFVLRGSEPPTPKVSTDAGVTWRDVTGAHPQRAFVLGGRFVAFDRSDESYPRLVQSPDGASWTVLSTLELGPGPHTVFGTVSDGGSRAVVQSYAQPDGGPRLHRTLDGGRTWEELAPLDYRVATVVFADSAGGGLLSFDRHERRHLRLVGDSAWVPTLEGHYVVAAVQSDGVVYAAGAAGEMHRSGDGGRTWELGGVVGGQVTGMARLPGGRVVAETFAGLYGLGPVGWEPVEMPATVWAKELSAGGNHLATVDFTGNLWVRGPGDAWSFWGDHSHVRGFAVAPDGAVYVTRSRPQRHEDRGLPLAIRYEPTDDGRPRPAPIEVPDTGRLSTLAALQSGALLAAGTDAFVRSEDRGASWTAVEGLPLPARLLEDRCTAGRVYASGSRGLFTSRDDGGTWRPVMRGESQQLAESVGACGDVILVARSRDRVSVLDLSEDGGETWREVAATNRMFEDLVVTDSVLVVSMHPFGGVGLFVSRDRGGSWWSADAGLPDPDRVTAMVYDGRKTYVGSVSHSVWETDGLPKGDAPLVAEVGISRDTVSASVDVYVRGVVTGDTVVDVEEAQGELVRSATLTTRQFAVRIDTSELPGGRYTVRLRSSGDAVDEFVVVPPTESD